MKTSRNYDGHEEQEGFRLLPNGSYMFEVFEKEDTESRDGDTMIKIILRCIEDNEYEGIYVWDNILLPEPDSAAHKIIGRSKRFLHAINEPYQGDFDVDTDDWIGKTVEAKISQGKYRDRLQNKVDGYLISKKQQNEKLTNSNSASKKVEQSDLPF